MKRSGNQPRADFRQRDPTRVFVIIVLGIAALVTFGIADRYL